MSRMFVLFVVDDLPQEYRLLLENPNLLLTTSYSEDVLDKVAWCRLGETADTSIGEKVPQAFQTIMGFFLRPQVLDDALEQRILGSLDPALAFPGFPDEQTGSVCEPEEMRPFLEENKNRRLSYLWL